MFRCFDTNFKVHKTYDNIFCCWIKLQTLSLDHCHSSELSEPFTVSMLNKKSSLKKLPMWENKILPSKRFQ